MVSFAALAFEDISARLAASTQLLGVYDDYVPVLEIPVYRGQILYDAALDPTYKWVDLCCIIINSVFDNALCGLSVLQWGGESYFTVCVGWSACT
jgi:hypothetical protein